MNNNKRFIPQPYEPEVQRKIQALKWVQHFQKTYSSLTTIAFVDWGSR